ncbi:MAG TPA: glycosyl hydrolase, partial [Paludibacter sp.]|nr:glycosyl hydrolase [Paludibacter sp.]
MKYTIRILFLLLISVQVFGQDRTIINITGTISNAVSFTNKEVIIAGKTDLHISASKTPLTNSVIKLYSEDSWVFFDNIRPQVVIDSVLSKIFINDVQAVNRTNVRVSIYRHGVVVIPHASGFQPIEVFTGQNLNGDTQKYSKHIYNNALDNFDNKIRSFKLKRGYMATLANNKDGSGYSRVFIASDGDLEISTMPTYLDRTVSFIRVFPWEWVSKKGWCQTGSMSSGDPITNTNKMNGTWLYTWSADNTTRPNIEYVPEKWQPFWPSWDQINSKENITHVMGYNEPDHTEQSNVSVATAVAQWPEFMKSGLRIGSPACTTFSTWLYPFMDSIKAHNYRCDYVVVHAYWGGYSASQWYNALKAIHDKTGRPIWIKEWNNGASWTTESWPSDYGASLTKQFNELKAILNVMDTAHFVERYSIYNWVGYKRMLIADDGWVTPAGELYRDNKPPLAYRKVNEVIPTYKYPSTVKPTLTLTSSADNSKIYLLWDKTDQEFAYELVVERKADDGTYTEVYRGNSAALPASYSELP